MELLSSHSIAHVSSLWNTANEERENRKWGKISSFRTGIKWPYVPQKICNIFNSNILDNVNKQITNKDQTYSVLSNTTNTQNTHLPEVLKADLIKVIHSMKNKKSTGLMVTPL
jgi:Leucine-rich repeat (LRR) protein